MNNSIFKKELSSHIINIANKILGINRFLPITCLPCHCQPSLAANTSITAACAIPCSSMHCRHPYQLPRLLDNSCGAAASVSTSAPAPLKQQKGPGLHHCMPGQVLHHCCRCHYYHHCCWVKNLLHCIQNNIFLTSLKYPLPSVLPIPSSATAAGTSTASAIMARIVLTHAGPILPSPAKLIPPPVALTLLQCQHTSVVIAVAIAIAVCHRHRRRCHHCCRHCRQRHRCCHRHRLCLITIVGESSCFTACWPLVPVPPISASA